MQCFLGDLAMLCFFMSWIIARKCVPDVAKRFVDFLVTHMLLPSKYTTLLFCPNVLWVSNIVFLFGVSLNSCEKEFPFCHLATFLFIEKKNLTGLCLLIGPL